jgi:hypothetical protein
MSDIVNKNKIAAIRRKIKSGTASDLEKALVAKWEIEHPRGRPTLAKTDSSSNPESVDGVAPERDTGAASASGNQTPTVETQLPGMGATTEPNLPPINVNHATGQSQSSANAGGAASNTTPNTGATQSTHTASGAGTNSGPRMNSAEQEASAEALATMATEFLNGFNEYNRGKGFPALPDKFVALFRFSTKRMAMRYGANINEEQMDATVIVGCAGFVGYQTYRAYRSDEESKPTAAGTPQPRSVEKEVIIEQRNPNPPTNSAGNNGNGTIPRTGGPQTIGIVRKQFDPKGWF